MLIAPINKLSKAERWHSRYRAHTTALLWENDGQGAIDYTALATKAILQCNALNYLCFVGLQRAYYL